MRSRETEKIATPAPALPEPASTTPRLAAVGTSITPPANWRPGVSAPPPALTAGPDAMALLTSLRRRWVLAICLGVTAAILGLVAVVLIVPMKYTAFASVQISLIKPTLVSGGTSDYRFDFPTLMKTQAARIKNRDVLVQALNQEQVRGLSFIRKFPDTFSAMLWLEQELKIDVEEGSEFINIQFNGEDPDEAVALVAAITKSYLSLVNGKEKSDRRDRAAKMQALGQASKDKLAEKIATRQGLYKGQGDPGSAAMQAKYQNLLAQLREAQSFLGRVQFELDKAKGKLAAHKASKKPLDITIVSDAFLKQYVNADPAIKEKATLVSLYQRAISRMIAEGHRPTDSTLVNAKEKYAELKKELDENRETFRKELFDQMREKMESDHKVIADVLEQEIPPLETQYKQTAEAVKSLTRETENVGYTTAKELVLSAEIIQEGKALDTLQMQLKDLQIEEESDYRVLAGQDAGWQNVSSKKRLIILALGPLAALGGALLCVAWLEFKARRIHTTDQVVTGLCMRVVGSVPNLASGRRQRRLAVQDPLAGSSPQATESIDGIRTMLLRSAAVDGTRVVMVTSAVSGEGKTTLSASLALSLARAGRKTLLVDCDLRRPAAHQLFEQTLQPGFSEAILGEVELPDAVRPTTSDDNLWLLPAGQWDREVLSELAKEQPAGIFERLRQEFDFIVVDSHPVLPAADSLLIGQHVDAVIVSVMRQVSQAPRVYEACQRLATLGIRIFGAVVNGMPSEEFTGSYNYKAPVAKQPVAVAA